MMAPRERESTRLGEAQRACELKLPDTRCKNFPTFSACAREKKKGNFSSSSYIPPSSGAFLSLCAAILAEKAGKFLHLVASNENGSVPHRWAAPDHPSGAKRLRTLHASS
jgi:hypothetical protein